MKHIKLFEEFVVEINEAAWAKANFDKLRGAEVNESMITEATRSQFGKIDKTGKITSVYVHSDGYPEYMTNIVTNYKGKDVDTILKLGKAGISYLDKKIGDAPMDFNNPTKGVTRFYGRDRGETFNMESKGDIKNIKKYLKDVADNSDAVYVYLYDVRDGNWYMADTYEDKELKPIQETLNLDEAFFIEFLNKDKNFTKDTKRFKSYAEAVKWAKANFDKFSPDMIKFESVNDVVEFKESLLVEGQFSWMTHDTGNQIGSEKQNTIEVTMFDDKGNKWLERKYDGYGEFGGKDYYELLAQMNGIENATRQDGIDIAFGKKKVKGKVLFPALVEAPNSFNWKRHDFTQEADNDPNQSWYQEEDD